MEERYKRLLCNLFECSRNARNTNRTGSKLKLTGSFFEMTGQEDEEGRERDRERGSKSSLSLSLDFTTTPARKLGVTQNG